VTGEGGPRSAPSGDAPAACPMCSSTHRIVDPVRSEVHCSECGLVFETGELITTRPAPSSDTASAGSGRGIGPFAPSGSARRALGSTLSLTRDGQGRRLDWHRRYEFQHLKRVMQRQTSRVTGGSADRSSAHGEMALVGDRLALPPVVMIEAERIFQVAKSKGLSRGRSLGASVGAAIYAACRRFAIPRTLSEISEAAGASRPDVGRAFKMIQREAELTIPSVGMKSFLVRYAEELALSSHVRSTVEAMMEEAQKEPELSGLSPHGLVAAMIYLAAEREGERRSRAQVARVSAVTEVTLRSTSRLLERVMGSARGHRSADPADRAT